jgi:hypothetical protein
LSRAPENGRLRVAVSRQPDAAGAERSPRSPGGVDTMQGTRRKAPANCTASMVVGRRATVRTGYRPRWHW